MEFKIKKIHISTGDALIAVLNKADAILYDIHNQDRIKIRNGGKEYIPAIIEMTDSDEIVPKGHIGLFVETIKKLKVKTTDKVKIEIDKKPASIASIKKKLDGHKLTYQDIKEIILDISHSRLTNIEMTYFVSSCYINGLTTKETYDLTRAMINTGDVLHFPNKIVMDKHCIGGVAGNRTTAIVVSIIAAAGYAIPKTSSRAITSAAGTSDTIEQLCNVNLSPEELIKVVSNTGGWLAWGGALNLAPADDKIIHVESPISLDPTGQLVASVLAKKKSVSANHVLIDIPIGKGAKIKDKKTAKKLKSIFQKIAKMLEMKTKVIITDGTHPIGNGIGPALEARDILYTLKNDLWGSWELKEKSIYLAGILLKMAGHRDGETIARKIIDSGKAYHKFIEIIKAQGGKEIDPDTIKLGKYTFDYISPKSGHIEHIDNKAINKICRICGSPIDPQAGVYLHMHKGKQIKEGELLYTVYSNNKERLNYAKDFIISKSGIEIK